VGAGLGLEFLFARSSNELISNTSSHLVLNWAGPHASQEGP
jgi:hypothetical protein